MNGKSCQFTVGNNKQINGNYKMIELFKLREIFQMFKKQELTHNKNTHDYEKDISSLYKIKLNYSTFIDSIRVNWSCLAALWDWTCDLLHSCETVCLLWYSVILLLWFSASYCQSETNRPAQNVRSPKSPKAATWAKQDTVAKNLFRVCCPTAHCGTNTNPHRLVLVKLTKYDGEN